MATSQEQLRLIDSLGGAHSLRSHEQRNFAIRAMRCGQGAR